MHQRNKADPKFYRRLLALLPPGASILDLACGDGTFLREAMRAGARRATGVELTEAGVMACVAAGLHVHQGDITEGLADYPDGAFDCVSLIRTVELLERPEPVLREMLRVGRVALVTVANFGHWRYRWRLCWRGIVPATEPWRLGGLPTRLSCRDFLRYCGGADITVLHTAAFPGNLFARCMPGLFARETTFILAGGEPRTNTNSESEAEPT